MYRQKNSEIGFVFVEPTAWYENNTINWPFIEERKYAMWQ